MKKIKCIIWDLDNTLWDGICLEGEVRLRQEVRRTVMELDKRGIIHSIASRGVEETAMAVLKKCALDSFFVYPRVNWLPKPTNIIAISKDLNISTDAIAFIDDDSFELEQAAYMLPKLLTIQAHKAPELCSMLEFIADEATLESSSRRTFYQAEEKRRREESTYPTREKFLQSCELILKVRPMMYEDIPRVLELMSRTHQLNTTGRIMAKTELLEIFNGAVGRREVMVSELTDRFASYGIIGAVILDKNDHSTVIEYLAISCRVLGRGIERALISFLAGDVQKDRTPEICALFFDTGKNREMRALFQMMGFKSSRQNEVGALILSADSGTLREPPSWVKVL